MQKNNSAPLPLVLAIVVAMLLSVSTAWAGLPEKVLVSFNGTTANEPMGLSIDATGNLWGVTNKGGPGDCSGATRWGCGTVFELTRTSDGWDAKVVYSFQGGSDGEYPQGLLAFDPQGDVYGVTSDGGSPCDCGTIYELTPVAGGYKETVIYSFNNTGTQNDGAVPIGGVIRDAAGNLYGATTGGGNGGGTVFELSPVSGGWQESILYNFTGLSNGSTDGYAPQAPLAFDGKGNLYGTTAFGNPYGVVFELTPNSGGEWTETILHNFEGNTDNGHDGARSYSGLVFDTAGNLYGTTFLGGDKKCDDPSGCGTVFELSPASGGAWTESIIHTFTQHDAEFPACGLTIDASGNLYGVTQSGGEAGLGTAFELTPSSGGLWTETILHSFGSGKDGFTPQTPLVFDSSGNLYGTTLSGGTQINKTCGDVGCGTVFQLTP